MEKIREVAIACIGRAVLFGSLAIGCVMVAFSFSPVSAFRAGAMLTLVMSVVLIFKAATAASQQPKHTEVWLYLDEKVRPTGAHAQYAFGTVMREVYGRFAQISLAVACGFFLASFVLTMFGLQPAGMPA